MEEPFPASMVMQQINPPPQEQVGKQNLNKPEKSCFKVSESYQIT